MPTITPSTIIPSTARVFRTLLRADLTTQWRNRRASIPVVLIPVVILVSWKGLIEKVGGTFVLANCMTVGLNAIGLMGYSNAIARDRDKGIFQRLRVAPASNWAIMASRLFVQLMMITILTIIIFIVGYQYDHITVSAGGYVLAFAMAIVGGAVYLSLGQMIVGLIKNPETVNATTRLVYFAFIVVGMFSGIHMLPNVVEQIAKWSPYGTVRNIVSVGLAPSTWSKDTSMALLATIGYTVVFSFLGIKWFRWSTR